MTDDVAAHVLRHNYDQTAALTLAEATAKQDHEALERLMVHLEDRGVLNRARITSYNVCYTKLLRADAGQVALHIGAEDRNAGIGKTLGEDLQRDGLAGAGRPGDQAMPV